MKKDGIEVGTLYATPLHLQPIYKALGQKCPKAEHALQHQIGLPMHVDLNKEDIVYIIDSLHNAIRGEKK
jgi:dTDP-4-amino-4,6-dideoxygalactose transaminase